jgi:hypothetical protein
MRSEGYSTWSVCPSVYQSVIYHVFCHHAQQTGKKSTPTFTKQTRLQNGDFRESAAFESYGKKPSQQAIMLISTGIPRPGLLALCILKAQVTTKGVYRLTQAIYYCR